MAGLGKKTFTAGDVLTASDVNNYLMDQTLMVFGGTAARASAIPTPSEGMFAVTTDNDQVDYYDGSAWVPALPVGAWQTYTPVLGGTGWSLGTTGASSVGQYVQLGKTVHFSVRMVFGTSGATFGAGRPTVTLPLDAASSSADFIVDVAFNDSGSNLRYQGTADYATSVLDLFVWNAASTYVVTAGVTSSVPMTWAASDAIFISGTYEAA